MANSASGPGILGTEGRVPATVPAGRTASLVLHGAPLPLISDARIYTCGITPYDVTHLGHASVFVWSDLLRSVTALLPVRPTLVRNVTDVDDVLTTAARRDGLRYDEFAVTHEFRFDRDMRSLAVAEPDHSPRARGHVGAVVRLATALLTTGHAYERGGTVFFRGAATVAASGLDPADAAARAEAFGDLADDGREERFDVPVWRPSDADQPAWPSPWGWGRPGWHAECSAMAAHVLGHSIDVLVGGADLTFPHHAYQAALVEAATGVAPFARRRMHIGTVRLDGQKMAKSTGNLVMVKDLLADHPGATVRLLLLHRRWWQEWDFTTTALDEAEELRGALYAAAGAAGSDPEAGRAAVMDALVDDLDVPGAVAAALDHRGEAARLLIRILKLSDTADV